MIKKQARGIAVAGAVLAEKSIDPQSGLPRISCAGSVSDIAMMLKTLSPRLPVSAIGCVGDDPEGRYIANRLRTAGVETSGLKTVPDQQTGFLQDTLDQGAAGEFGVCDVIFRDLRCKILHLGDFLALEKITDGDGRNILKHARQWGIQTSLSIFDGSSQRYAAVLAALPRTDYLIVSLSHGAKLTNMEENSDHLEKIARQLLWYGVKKKVFIYSPDWVICCNKTQSYRLGNYILPDFAASNEAQGQAAFCAGVLNGLCSGWGDMKILETATACAAAKQCGAQTASVQNMEDDCKQLKRHKKVL